tara:strand:- start:40 stop:387 length:348 start_codon:yes stop_codon:yes gene_type:complete
LEYFSSTEHVFHYHGGETDGWISFPVWTPELGLAFSVVFLGLGCRAVAGKKAHLMWLIGKEHPSSPPQMSFLRDRELIFPPPATGSSDFALLCFQAAFHCSAGGTCFGGQNEMTA